MKSKRKKTLVLLMVITLLSQLVLLYALAELKGSLIIGPGEEMHRVTFKDANGTLLDEMNVKNGTDMRALADHLSNSLGTSLIWQSDSQSALRNIISDTTFTAAYAGIVLFGMEEPLLSVAKPKPGLEIYDSDGNLIQNNSTIGLAELLLMKLRFEVFETSSISAGTTYVYPLPMELTSRPGGRVVLMNNGVIFGEAWIEDSTFKVVFTDEAVHYPDSDFTFGYECTQAFNLGCLDEDGKIPDSIVIYIDGEETIVYILAEDGSPTIKSKSVAYKTNDPRYTEEPFVLGWTITVDPYKINGVAVPMPATIEDAFDFDMANSQSQTATEQEYIEGSMVVKVGNRTLDVSEYILIMRDDNSGFTLELPEFSEPVTITYTTKPANGWKGLLDASGSLEYSNTARLTENGEPVGNEVNASHTYYPNYISKAFSSIEQTENSYRVTWDIEVLKLYYSYPFLLSGTYVEDLLANGVEFVGLFKSNGDAVPEGDPSGSARNTVYYELVGDNLTIHFPNGADTNTTLKLVLDYPLDWAESISNTTTLVIPDEGEKSTTVEVGSDGSRILKQSQGFDRKTNAFRWTVTIFAGDGLEGACFRDYPDYWNTSYYGATSSNGTSQFSRIVKITGYDMSGNALDFEMILRSQNEYAAPNGGTYTEFLLGDIKGVVVIELETTIADDKEFTRAFYNTAKVIDKNNKESSSSTSYYLYETDYAKTYLPRDEALKQFPGLADNEVAWMISARFNDMDEMTIDDELGANLTFSNNKDHYKSSITNGWSNFMDSSYISNVSGGPGETALTFTVKKPSNATSFYLYFVAMVGNDAFTDVSGAVHVNNRVTYLGDGLPEGGVDRNAPGTLAYAAMKKTGEIQPGLARWIITINSNRKVDFFSEAYQKATVTDVLHPSLRLDHGKSDVSLTNEAGDSVDFDFSYDPGIDGNTVRIVFDCHEANGHTLTLAIDTTILANFTANNQVVLSAEGFKIGEAESLPYPLEKDAIAYIETDIYLNIEKVDEYDDEMKLGGVLFQLYLPGGTAPVAYGTTNSEGKVSFRDLDYQAQYILVEQGIEGYHWLEGTIGGHEHAMLVFPGPANHITTITNRPIIGRIVVAKVDAEDEAVTLEGAVFTLYKDETEVDKQITDQYGVAAFENLRSGIYTLKETEPPSGYQPLETVWIVEVELVDGENVVKITENDGHNLLVDGVLTVANRGISESEWVSVAGTKAWDDNGNLDGKRPASITVNLLADGKKVDDKTVSEAGGWTYEWTDLPRYNGGLEIAYSVAEDPVDGYSATVTGYDIHNSYTPEPVTPETVTVSGTKTWDDNGNLDGKHPVSITVNLLADDEKVGVKTVRWTEGWTYEWTDLPKYNGGLEIAYSVTEDPIDGYSATVTGFDIHNSYMGEVATLAAVTVSGTKTWDDNGNLDGKRPASIAVNLLADGKKVAAKIVSEADGWTYEWTDLPRYSGGLEIAYSVTEDPIDGYSATVTNYGIHNRSTQVSLDITIRKCDAETRNALAGAKFALEGGSPRISQTATTDSNGLATFSGLMPGTYTLRETQAPNGYARRTNTWTILVNSDGTVMNEGLNLTDLVPTISNQKVSPDESNPETDSKPFTMPKTRDYRNRWAYWLLLPISAWLIGGYYLLKRKR